MKMQYRPFRKKVKPGILSLRQRFVLYVVSAIVVSVMLLLILLSLFGVLNPANSPIDSYLDVQLDNHVAQIEHDIGRMAAYSLSFSEQMETLIDNYLAEHSLSFDDLTNDLDALIALQAKAYGTVYTNIRIAPCSGAFYILNTTVNSSLDTPSYNGIYIKFANLYAEATINTKIALFRGSSEIARNNGINLCSTWQNEMRTDVFADTSVFSEKSYVMSSVTKIPDTWERARYIYSPIYGRDGQVIGICGFEMSDLYLQLVYSTTDTESSQTVCALLDKADKGYVGQFVSNRSGYVPPACESITVKERSPFCEYQCGEYEYIGKSKDVDFNGNAITIAMMFPEQQYESIVRDGQLKNIAIFFIIATVATCACLWLSKKYITPIKKSITQIKTNQAEYTPSGIAEIDDLFAFLAEQDRKNTAALAEMESQKAKMQTTLDQMSSEHSEAKREIARLAYSRKNEVNPDDYEQFLLGIHSLTPMERTVFDYYLEGKSVKEIVQLIGFKESTIRFHNRNIYSKLGVNSLKQLLLFAAVMKRSEEGGDK